jgi:hypothetical protein
MDITFEMLRIRPLMRDAEKELLVGTSGDESKFNLI